MLAGFAMRHMLRAVALLALTPTSRCFYAPGLRSRRSVSLEKKSRGSGEIVTDDEGEPDDAMMAELRERMLAQELEAKRDETKAGGSNRLAAQYVQLLTRSHPSELVRDFYAGASPAAQGAMQDAIVGLLGAGAVDAEFTTDGRRVAELCFRLQMTGYMLRNAEYVLAVQNVLRLNPSGRTPRALRDAFRRVDADGSGYIDVGEVDALFRGVYGLDDLPEDTTKAERNAMKSNKDADVASFLSFFDANKDGKISFSEFTAALGGADATKAQIALEEFGGTQQLQLGPADDAPPELPPNVSGDITVGDRVVDAAVYVAELKAEAAALKAALARTTAAGPTNAVTSIGTYIASLDESQRELLTSTMTPDARDAAQELVKYVLSGTGGDPDADTGAGPTLAPDQQVTLERRVLDQICRWQIVVGYRLRELEASGEAAKRLGA